MLLAAQVANRVGVQPNSEANGLQPENDDSTTKDLQVQQLGHLSLNEQPIHSQDTAQKGTITPFIGRCSISILPDELLVEILTYGTAGPDGYQQLDLIEASTDRARAPFIVSAVCTRWRSAATAASRLWHYILVPRLYVSNDRDQWQERTLCYLEAVLTRSREVPIDLILQFLDKALIAHRSRWRRFVAVISGSSMVQATLNCLTAPTPRLRTVQLAHQTDTTAWMWNITPLRLPEKLQMDSPILPDAPSLVFCTVINIPWVLWQAPTLRVRPTMTSLELVEEVLDSRIWDILRDNPQIDWLVLGAQIVPDVPPAQPLELPNLKTLRMVNSAHMLFILHFAHLRMPKVDELTLIYTPTTIVGLEPFFRSTRNTLVFLDFRDLNGLSEADVSAMAALTKLEDAQFCGCRLPNALFVRLAQVERSEMGDLHEVMWPRLQTLGLYTTTVEDVAAGSLVDLARARARQGPFEGQSNTPRWSRLKLEFGEHKDVPSEQMDEIVRIMNEGWGDPST
ncbi:hypothetical protein BKA62DRAFT_725726 [Auriculariales sp. MPI-PUGE-AT-0066]|nr:hypothetical protein BKA62DRAFT_725726 [Auriculariales sp. MPI-PUGE-AT-0066]